MSKMSELIRELYQHNSRSQAFELENKSLNVSARIDTYSLLMVVSSHFQLSLSDLCSEILDEAAEEIWEALNEEDREVLSMKADSETTSQLAARGITPASTAKRWHRRLERRAPMEDLETDAS